MIKKTLATAFYINKKEMQLEHCVYVTLALKAGNEREFLILKF